MLELQMPERMKLFGSTKQKTEKMCCQVLKKLRM